MTIQSRPYRAPMTIKRAVKLTFAWTLALATVLWVFAPSLFSQQLPLVHHNGVEMFAPDKPFESIRLGVGQTPVLCTDASGQLTSTGCTAGGPITTPASFTAIIGLDSRTAGNVVAPAHPWASPQILGSMNAFAGAQILNDAVGGATVGGVSSNDETTRYTSTTSPVYLATGKTVQQWCQSATTAHPVYYMMWGAYNNYGNTPVLASGADTYTAYYNLMQQAKTDHCIPVAFTDVVSKSLATTYNADVQAFNLAVKTCRLSSSCPWAAVVDFDALRFDPGDSNVMGDGIHQTAAMQVVLAGAVNAVFGGTPSPVSNVSSPLYPPVTAYQRGDLYELRGVTWMGDGTFGKFSTGNGHGFFGHSLCSVTNVGDSCGSGAPGYLFGSADATHGGLGLGSDTTWLISRNGGTTQWNAPGNVFHNFSSVFASPSPTTIPDIARGFSGQTAMLRENIDISGNVLGGVLANGTVVGPAYPNTLPTASSGTITGNNNGGRIDSLSGATSVTITFATPAYVSYAYCTATPSVSLAASPYASAVSQTAVTFNFPSLTGSLFYACGGY